MSKRLKEIPDSCPYIDTIIEFLEKLEKAGFDMDYLHCKSSYKNYIPNIGSSYSFKIKDVLEYIREINSDLRETASDIALEKNERIETLEKEKELLETEIKDLETKNKLLKEEKEELTEEIQKLI